MPSCKPSPARRIGTNATGRERTAPVKVCSGLCISALCVSQLRAASMSRRSASLCRAAPEIVRRGRFRAQDGELGRGQRMIENLHHGGDHCGSIGPVWSLQNPSPAPAPNPAPLVRPMRIRSRSRRGEGNLTGLPTNSKLPPLMRWQTLFEARWIFAVLVVLALLSLLLTPWLALLFLLLIGYTFAFFRDPERLAPADPAVGGRGGRWRSRGNCRPRGKRSR